jgi:hypothetical protein
MLRRVWRQRHGGVAAAAAVAVVSAQQPRRNLGGQHQPQLRRELPWQAGGVGEELQGSAGLQQRHLVRLVRHGLVPQPLLRRRFARAALALLCGVELAAATAEAARQRGVGWRGVKWGGVGCHVQCQDS